MASSKHPELWVPDALGQDQSTAANWISEIELLTDLPESVADISPEQAYQLGVRQGRVLAQNSLRASNEATLAKLTAQHNKQQGQQLNELVSKFSAQLQGAQAKLAQQLIELAAGIAAAAVRQHIELNSDAIVPIVTEAINKLLPANTRYSIAICPADEAIVRQALSEDLAKGLVSIKIDPQLTKSDCKVVSATTEVDHYLETRWLAALEKCAIVTKQSPTAAPALEPRPAPPAASELDRP